jgi:C4-dicarboxylate-specific signal transduction histidine kinase
MQGVTVTEAESRMLTAHQDGSTLLQPDGEGALAALSGRGSESLLVLPLFRSHELLGGIVLSYRKSPDMHEDHLVQLRQLADQVAVALSNASDLAERKRAETSLRESHTQLEAAMTELKTTQQQMVQQERLRALGQMASGIAHDFNNTLSPIMGFSELPAHRAPDGGGPRATEGISADDQYGGQGRGEGRQPAAGFLSPPASMRTWPASSI